jgi:hypothetical protein
MSLNSMQPCFRYADQLHHPYNKQKEIHCQLILIQIGEVYKPTVNRTVNTKASVFTVITHTERK